jgi:SAM-dependent methyltransferase
MDGFMKSYKEKFCELKIDEYFVKRPTVEPTSFEENYWGVVCDPDGVARDIGKERDQKRELAATELSFINALSPGKVLDIGCGTGAILEGIDDVWDKYGVEISKYAATEAKKYANIYLGELKDAAYPSQHFDVVILFHVIEHLTSPEDVLIEVRRILKDGGRLLVGTPDFDSGCAQRFNEKFRLLHDVTHISLFSNESLQRLLNDFGFNVRKTEFEFFKTKYFTQDNLSRLFDTTQMSPPFYGNIMTKYCIKQTWQEVSARISYLKDIHERNIVS